MKLGFCQVDTLLSTPAFPSGTCTPGGTRENLRRYLEKFNGGKKFNLNY